jgi:hypothetical protein
MNNSRFKTTVFKLLGGYVVGALLLALILILSGAEVRNVIKVLMLWLPINAVYGLAIVLLLRRMGLAQMVGMSELCGVCIGVMPQFSGLWPTYWMRWDVALVMIAIQCIVLTVVVSICALLQKTVKR